jgi:uncharacterized integral membrane protein
VTEPSHVDDAAMRRRRRRLARTVAGLVVLVAIVSFVVQNTRAVTVKLWFYTGHPELIWVVVGSLVVGGFIGYLVGHPGRRRRLRVGRRGRRGLRGGEDGADR